MGFFAEQIGELRGHLGEAWEPPMPSYKIPASKVMALSQLIQLNGTQMLQLSRAIAKGNIRGARLKLRRIYQRMDSALRQMDDLDRKMKRSR